MSVVFFAACRRLARSLSAAIALTLIGAVVGAQTPTPTQDQLNIFKNLPQDQQDALMQSLLGGKGDATNKKSDSQLESPETVKKKNDRTGEREQEENNDKTKDGHTLRKSDEDPELRAGDYVLIDLTPVELDKDGNLIVHSTGNQASGSSTPAAAAAAAAGAGTNSTDSLGKDNKNTSASDFGRLRVEQRPRTPEETTRSATVRDRILKGNPYKLNRFGVLEIPGLPSIPLAGLTADEATRRLSADPDLRDYNVKLTLLRLEPLDDENAKPFGYDLFEGAPSTFAPVKDIQVPIDYVVGPGDTFNIQLYGNETASYSLTVGRDGRIKFPKLGPISVSGMGFDAAREALEHGRSALNSGLCFGRGRKARLLYCERSLHDDQCAVCKWRRQDDRFAAQHRAEAKRSSGLCARSLRFAAARRHQWRSSADAGRCHLYSAHRTYCNGIWRGSAPGHLRAQKGEYGRTTRRNCRWPVTRRRCGTRTIGAH